MASTVLIDRAFGETRLARLVDDRLTDLFLFRDEDPDPTGEIHRARLRRAAPALGGAFLEIGEGREAFLKGRALPPEGSLVTVEIRAEGGPGKLPIATTSLSRPLAAHADTGAPALLDRDPRPWLRLIADGEQVRTDSPEIMAALRVAGRSAEAVLKHGALFAEQGLEDEIMALVGPEVALPGGARLWIEETRALTAIDLDSGAMGEGRTNPAAARAVNDRAVPEIARQLRLRRIGGLVVIDFLRLPDKAMRMALTDRLVAALGPDPVASEVSGFSRLGLFELKRPRTGRPLARDLGAGGRPTLATAARAALRAAHAHARHQPGQPVTLTVAPAVARWIGHRDLEATFFKESGAAIVLRGDPDLEPGRIML